MSFATASRFLLGYKPYPNIELPTSSKISIQVGIAREQALKNQNVNFRENIVNRGT